MRQSIFSPLVIPREPDRLVAYRDSKSSLYQFRRRILREVAKSCDCRDDKEIDEFCQRLPVISNPISTMPGFESAIVRIIEAVEKNEKIVVYGDFDCDGVT